MPTDTAGLIVYDLAHYAWLVFPITLLYLAWRPRAWWTPERARYWARVLGILCSLPGVFLLIRAISILFYAAAMAALSAQFGRVLLMLLLPGALFFGLGCLVFRKKKISLPIVSVLVALNGARFMATLSHTPFPYTGLVWFSVAVAFGGQLLFIFYLYRMRQWGYFQ